VYPITKGLSGQETRPGPYGPIARYIGSFAILILI